MLSTVGFGVLLLAGVGKVWEEMASFIQGESLIIYQAGTAAVLIALFGSLLYWIFWLNHRSAEFLIATEAEMRKVNWPTRREVMISTIVVIAGTLLMAGFLWVVDFFFLLFFQGIGVLEA
jgi:preprotein translocase subunit SecE